VWSKAAHHQFQEIREMGTENGVTCIDLIGETAGAIWHSLEKNGQMSLTKLGKEIDAPRDVVMQAIGWLAREDKIAIEEKGRAKVISLN
jgi:hypothetical protein